MGIVLWAGYRLFLKYHREAARIKRAHDWSTGERRVVRADTTLILSISDWKAGEIPGRTFSSIRLLILSSGWPMIYCV
ncbi:hypothetical protein [Paenibacillus zanthoxyli]|uniref:hypothetical protein n=1 Tax=Paenibacillus zanthoxyli TaxID=369399 RepID=UPI00046EC0C6|nr:hypothetical protein [Paenibacillus zanthoxyli]